MSKKRNLKKQFKLSFFLLLAELPNFICVTATAIISKSLIVWMDFLDCLCNLMQTFLVLGLIARISKKGIRKYTYGSGKMETVASLFCDGIEFFGLLVMLVVAVDGFIHPKVTSDLLFIAAGLKIVNVGFDVAFLIPQYKIRKQSKTKIIESNYAAAIGAFSFDVLTLFSVLVVWLLRDIPWSYYLSPAITVVLAFVLIYFCCRRLRKSLDELSDKTLPEDEKEEILDVIVKYIDCYSTFHSIKVKIIDEVVYVDFYLSFDEETTYEQVVDFKNKLKKDISELIEKCEINIIVV